MNDTSKLRQGRENDSHGKSFETEKWCPWNKHIEPFIMHEEEWWFCSTVNFFSSRISDASFNKKRQTDFFWGWIDGNCWHWHWNRSPWTRRGHVSCLIADKEGQLHFSPIYRFQTLALPFKYNLQWNPAMLCLNRNTELFSSRKNGRKKSRGCIGASHQPKYKFCPTRPKNLGMEQSSFSLECESKHSHNPEWAPDHPLWISKACQ